MTPKNITTPKNSPVGSPVCWNSQSFLLTVFSTRAGMFCPNLTLAHLQCSLNKFILTTNTPGKLNNEETSNNSLAVVSHFFTPSNLFFFSFWVHNHSSNRSSWTLPMLSGSNWDRLPAQGNSCSVDRAQGSQEAWCCKSLLSSYGFSWAMYWLILGHNLLAKRDASWREFQGHR